MTIRYPDLAALVLRLGFGAYMLFGHGVSKFEKLLAGGDIKFVSLLGVPPKICLTLAVLAEVIASVCIMVGYKTRLATIPLIFTMIVAAFYIHGDDPFFMSGSKGGSKEPALVYLFGFLAIYLLGSGKYSVDDKLDSVI